MLPFLTLLSLASAVLKVDFQIASNDNGLGGLSKRDPVEMNVLNEQAYYAAEIYIGSNREKILATMDTGSSDLWIPASDSFCVIDTSDRGIAVSDPDTEAADFRPDLDDSERATTCLDSGSFNTGESESFEIDESQGDLELLYVDGTYAFGVWGSDTISFDSDGEGSVSNFTFGVANVTNKDNPIFGIGFPELGTANNPYDNFPLKLKTEGIIKKNAYSLYLNDWTASSGSILFGGVDHAKYEGPLVTVPFVPYKDDGVIDRVVVNLSGVKVETPDSNYTIVDNQNLLVLLDSGATQTHLKPDLFKPLAETLGAEFDESVGLNVVPCPSAEDPTYITLDFNGAILKASLVELVTAFQGFCFLGIFESDENQDYSTLGANLLRNGYLVYDLDDKEVSIAQAKFTDESDIEEIESSIPSAVRAENYDSTIEATSVDYQTPGTASYPTGSVSDHPIFAVAALISNAALQSDSDSDASATPSNDSNSNGSSAAGSTLAGAANTGSSDSSSGSSNDSDNSANNSDNSVSSGSTVSFASFAVLISMISFGIWI